MEVQVGQVWVALGVQDLMGAQCQEAQGMGINTEDSMEHLVSSKGDNMEMVPRVAGEDTISNKDTPNNSPGTQVRVVQTINRPRTMLQHGQHIMPNIMLSMEDMEGSMVSNRDNSSPSNLLSSLKHRSNSQHHPNRIMLNRQLTLPPVKQITAQLGLSTTDNRECITRRT